MELDFLVDTVKDVNYILFCIEIDVMFILLRKFYEVKRATVKGTISMYACAASLFSKFV